MAFGETEGHILFESHCLKAKNEVSKALMERELGKSLNYGWKLSRKPHVKDGFIWASPLGLYNGKNLIKGDYLSILP